MCGPLGVMASEPSGNQKQPRVDAMALQDAVLLESVPQLDSQACLFGQKQICRSDGTASTISEFSSCTADEESCMPASATTSNPLVKDYVVHVVVIAVGVMPILLKPSEFFEMPGVGLFGLGVLSVITSHFLYGPRRSAHVGVLFLLVFSGPFTLLNCLMRTPENRVTAMEKTVRNAFFMSIMFGSMGVWLTLVPALPLKTKVYVAGILHVLYLASRLVDWIRTGQTEVVLKLIATCLGSFDIGAGTAVVVHHASTAAVSPWTDKESMLNAFAAVFLLSLFVM